MGCKRIWGCHICHNEKCKCGLTAGKDCETRVICGRCRTRQPWTRKFTNCFLKFSEYSCKPCKRMCENTNDNYHCSKCGICRKNWSGMFHCEGCDTCLRVTLRGNHKCRKEDRSSECPICMESLFEECEVLGCTHRIHQQCLSELLRSGNPRCSLCRQELVEPAEGENTQTEGEVSHGDTHSQRGVRGAEVV